MSGSNQGFQNQGSTQRSGSTARPFLLSAVSYGGATGRWTELPCDQRARSMHSATLVRDRILVFAGNIGQATNDLWELDIATGNWEMKDCFHRFKAAAVLRKLRLAYVELWTTQEPLGIAPDERTYHSAVEHDGRLLVFGGAPAFPSFAKWGMGAGAAIARSDVHCYDANESSWELKKTNGLGPSGRHGHSAVVAGDSMFVFAGYGAASFNDLWRLDLKTWDWEEIKPGGTPPCPRWRQAAVVHEGKMYVFGGNTRDSNSANLGDLHCYDIERNEWTQVECGGDVPSARHDHSLVQHERGLLLFGGNVGGRKDMCAVNDVYEYDLGANQWLRVATVPPVPAARASHTAVAVPSGMFVFGGDSKDAKLRDGWLFSW